MIAAIALNDQQSAGYRDDLMRLTPQQFDQVQQQAMVMWKESEATIKDGVNARDLVFYNTIALACMALVDALNRTALERWPNQVMAVEIRKD